MASAPVPQEFKKATIALPTGFQIHPVPEKPTHLPVQAAPSLGPLAAFTGDWTGKGFNTIFRPDNAKTPTVLPIPVPPGDNILELNLTTETLSFSKSLGAVPNRGSDPQGDVFLNGVPYLQAITDVTDPKHASGIHLEPGLWIIVPPTSDPAEGQTVARMASIPHGTTIEAEGTSTTFNGPPVIPPVSITPFTIAPPHNPIVFPSQTAATNNTPRIPQDLTTFIAAGTITQAILNDPNTVLRNHLVGQTIKSTTAISISTAPAAPITGGGADNIAFLIPNAQSVQMKATFWIETVEHTILVPVFKLGEGPLTLQAENAVHGHAGPIFTVHPPINIPVPRRITFFSTQIQYSQTVLLNFKGLSWPHVSVATLTPADPIPVPISVWS